MRKEWVPQLPLSETENELEPRSQMCRITAILQVTVQQQQYFFFVIHKYLSLWVMAEVLYSVLRLRFNGLLIRFKVLLLLLLL